VASQKKIYFIQEIIPVGVKGKERVVEVSLEDAIGAIHRAVADGVDHIIPAADVVGCPGAGFQAFPVEAGDEKNLLSRPEGIVVAEKILDEGSPVPNPLNGNMRKGLENGLRNPVFFSLFLEINFFDLKRHPTCPR
jgi:hypothetical protein